MAIKYDFRDGNWVFEDDKVIVQVDNDTFHRHVTRVMEERGLPTVLGLHLQQKLAPTLRSARCAIAKELRNPFYWLGVKDAKVLIWLKVVGKKG